jgi:predicted RNA polymerase sigma factor
MGWIALRSGQAARAQQLAAQADRLAGGKSAHALDVLASALRRLGRVAEANRVLDRALQLPLSASDRAYFQRLRQGRPPRPAPR